MGPGWDRRPPLRDPALLLLPWIDRVAAGSSSDDRGRSTSRIGEDDAAVALVVRRAQLNCTNNLAADAGVEDEQRRGVISSYCYVGSP